MPGRLSVCLLTRNEEFAIERAIRSIREVADEVVVAETGSTDRTAERARGLGARVVPVGWDDDFASGRNAALEAASGDWIFWLNPDEELVPGLGDRVRALIDHAREDRDLVGYLVRVQHLMRADRPEAVSETWDLRLFRRRDDLRYAGRIHPRLGPASGEERAGQGGRVAPSDLAVRRHAYASTLDETKLRWAVRLLEKQLADGPARLVDLIEYGRNLLRLGDPKGHEVMAEAIDRVASAAAEPRPPGPEAQLVLDYVLSTPPDPDRSRMATAQAASLAIRWFPESPALLWSLAGSYARSGQVRAAAVLYERLVKLGLEGRYDRSQPFDPGILGPRALLELGRCRLAMGDLDGARRSLRPVVGDEDLGDRASALLARIESSSTDGS